MELCNKIAVVTGGANGIGRCIVEAFLDQGDYVAFADIDRESGEWLEQKVPSRLMFYHGDLAEENALTGFARAVIARFGRVDCLVNNACVSRKGILSGCGFEDFEYVLRLGVAAPYHLTRLLLNHFSPGASIINIASTRAVMSQPDTESYTAAKGGIAALTHGLAVSLSGKVRVNCISPGWIDTSAYQTGKEQTAEFSDEDRLQHPAGRVGTPEDIAQLVLYLSSDKAGFITGENITVDGGMTRQMIYHNDFGWAYKPKEN